MLGRRGPCESSMVKKANQFFASGDSFVPEKNGVLATKLDDFNPCSKKCSVLEFFYFLPHFPFFLISFGLFARVYPV